MCEFKVILDGQVVAEDVIYAREEGSAVILRSVIGDEKRVEGCRIIEVDSVRERLVLAKA
ncbi:hypothetical protein DRO33_01035 [Candidatus Bathyarchaeota archaeon]|nr:MAG: hypothetical protein DRO33_01035 [Candidatus Bathyarchaeota archaeon]